MAEIDIETTISDVKIFIEKLKNDLPEVFSSRGLESSAPTPGKVLYQGDLLESDIIVNPDMEKSSAVLENGRVVIYLKSKDDNAGGIVENWLRSRATEILTRRAGEWAEKMGVRYNNIAIKDQKTMWASCSQKNNLNFSYRIIKMPKVIMDYLIVHELAHLIHFNHGADYWATVAQYCPDYKEHRKWLNNNKYAVLADVEIKYIPPSEQNTTETAVENV